MSSPDVNRTPLADRPVPDLHEAQLAELSNREVLHVGDRGEFDPAAMLKSLAECDGQQVVAVDIGGDKISVTDFEVRGGKLHPIEEFTSESTRHGLGYIEILEERAGPAHANEIPVGIAFPGPVDESSPQEGANVPELMRDLKKYGGSFAGGEEAILFGEQLKALANDAVAGTYAAAVEAKRQNPGVQNVIYLINGSGVGGAVWSEGRVIATEPGHVRVLDDLNPLGRTADCGFLGQKETCVERIAGGKAGIEASWEEATGEALGGREIAQLAREGDLQAVELYDTAAQLSALAVFGVAKALKIDISREDTMVVCHGGVFKFEDFADRFKQIMHRNGLKTEVILTHDFSENACLNGAALAALKGATQ